MVTPTVMRTFHAAMLITVFLASSSCRQGPKPPVAKIMPTKLEKHGHVRTDNYFWLKERDKPEVIDYLKAENQYTEAIMAHTADLQAKLFDEFKTRIKQTDESAPYRKDGYYYYSRVEQGRDYPIYCRRKGSPDAPEQVLIDVNQIAAGHGFCSVPPPAVTTSGAIMAYAVDLVGRRFFDVRFRNLETGEEYRDVIRNITGNVVWAEDNKTLFYSRQHPETLRSYQIFRHVLGADPAGDTLVFEEKDETFSTYVLKTKSKKYILIASRQTLSAEYRFLDAAKPAGEFRVFLPRQRDHEYQIDHFGDQFYIRTNLQAKNFRLMKTPVARTAVANWKEVLPHRADVFFEDMEIFKDHLVVSERKAGLIQLRVMPWSGQGEHYIDFGEPVYVAATSQNYELDTPLVRYDYSSLTTPNSVYDYNMVTREKKLVKRDEVLGGFDPTNYQSERLFATARDGTQVPISLVYRKGFRKDGKAPLLLYGYGSYGISTDPNFSAMRISLLDRGFAYAIAHVRGGQEMGRSWYEDGKLLKKKNTFTDFIDCADYLVKEKYTSPERLFAEGGSAGGLLMGAIFNMRPDLFKGVVAQVPFVDVVTTMLDDSIPLTTAEYDEWGNPNEKPYYDYMLSYSPYDNVAAKHYPNLLVTTGLHDSQVQYWEPAKWVAKLRAMKTDKNRLLLKTEMEAGHGGASGRDKRYKEIAFIYAFLLDLV
ncbi:MAG TPA: S9 family peptidase [Bryobacteraceae bacterium]|nr:S9 family peptidase [Bryobacteraceae bacterium]